MRAALVSDRSPAAGVTPFPTLLIGLVQALPILLKEFLHVLFRCHKEVSSSLAFYVVVDSLVDRFIHGLGPVSYTHLTLPTILLV